MSEELPSLRREGEMSMRDYVYTHAVLVHELVADLYACAQKGMGRMRMRDQLAQKMFSKVSETTRGQYETYTAHVRACNDAQKAVRGSTGVERAGRISEVVRREIVRDEYLGQHPQVAPFIRIQALLDTLMRRRDQVKRMTTDEKVIESAEKVLRKKIAKSDVVAIDRTDPLSVVITLKKDVYHILLGKEKESIWGNHVRGTPFCFALESDRADQHEEVFWHERVHNLTEDEVHIYAPEAILDHTLARARVQILRAKSQGKDPLVHASDVIAQLGDPWHYINALQGELVAAVRHAARERFKKIDVTPEKALLASVLGIRLQAENRTKAFRTASRDYADFKKALRAAVHTNDDVPELRPLLRKLSKDVEDGFSKATEGIQKMYHMIWAADVEARPALEEYAHILMSMFLPSQYALLPIHMAYAITKGVPRSFAIAPRA